MPKYKSKGGYYAVRRGITPGIYTSWTECEVQVKGFPKAIYKRFDTKEEAEVFLNQQVSHTYIEADQDMMRRAPRSLSSPSPRFHPSHSPSSPSGRYFQRPVPSPPLPTSSLIPRYPSSPPPSPPLAVAAIHRPPSPIAAFHTTTPLEARRPSATKAPTKPPLEVYADGSCFYNGRGSQATGGVGVYFGPDDPRNVSEPLPTTTDVPATNNRAEITAVLRALQVVIETEKDEQRPVVIWSDSLYCINALNSWLKSWQSNGWLTTEQTPVKNQDLWQQIVVLMEKHPDRFKWSHVTGHSGVEGNEAADKLARLAQNRKSK